MAIKNTFGYDDNMNPESQKIRFTYYLLTLLSTLAASFIWGVNTLFLLDAGLSNTAAFAANAFFTLGQVIFEVPTGVIADTRGRRTSYALGAGTLLLTTLLYYWLWQIQGPFWAWAAASALLGLGFTFFSGATEAWLVDALKFTGYKDGLENVFAKGQMIGGIAMLVGSVSGGFIAQLTNLGVPYIIRAAILAVTLIVSLVMMRDVGFSPRRGQTPIKQIRAVLTSSIEHGLKQPAVRWVMLAAPFTMGVSFYVFYAMQPFLLELYGDPQAYGIAGLAAAIVACSQIAGGLAVKYVRKIFKSRTNILIAAVIGNVLAISLLGFVTTLWAAIALLVIWGLLFSLSMPVRQAYLNGLIRSEERATVLSFDSLIGSSGGVVTQPVLGRAADVYGYAPSYLISAVVQAGAIPFLIAAKKQRPNSDKIEK